MNRDKLGTGADLLEGIGDRLETLTSAVGDLHIHEGHVRRVTAAHHFLIFGIDHQHRLRHVVARDEQFGRAQPDGTAIEIDERLLFLALKT